MKINLLVCAVSELFLVGQSLQSLFGPFWQPISHTSSFGRKITKFNGISFMGVIVFSEMLPKSSSNDTVALKISILSGQ